MWSLADLADEMLGVQLRKPQDLRTGNWEKRPLSVKQLEYAAGDAYAGLRLWQVGKALLCTLCAWHHRELGTWPTFMRMSEALVIFVMMKGCFSW